MKTVTAALPEYGRVPSRYKSRVSLRKIKEKFLKLKSIFGKTGKQDEILNCKHLRPTFCGTNL